ncbi:MAG TPA: nuclear transport factor 2 family protein [Actinocrinis sp.]|jgi:hypothetical protein
MAVQQPTGVIAEQIAAVNAHDTEAIVAAFAPDAYLNDNGREFRGAAALREWVEREVVAAKVTVEVREVVDHYGDAIVRAVYDGDFDRTGMPPEILLSNYYAVRDGKITSLLIVFRPAAS